MTPPHVLINVRWAGRMLAWSALMATTLLFAGFLQALATSDLVPTGLTAPSTACDTELAAQGETRESFLAHSCGGASGTTSKH
jgi:hypothetical protein